MPLNVDEMGAVLRRFVDAIPGVQGAAVVTADGLPLATSLPSSMNDERAAAMTAAMLSMGERIGRELSRGGVERVLVEGAEGYSLLMRCGGELALLTLATREVKQGLLLYEVQQLVQGLSEMVQAQSSVFASVPKHSDLAARLARA
ncbi:MAG: roadblock/LC7 domain-containing protein [Polyangiales bacterium]